MIHILYWDHNQPPPLPLKIPQIPSSRDHEALNRGTLGGLGMGYGMWPQFCGSFCPQGRSNPGPPPAQGPQNMWSLGLKHLNSNDLDGQLEMFA